jgi:hypothetical protein
MFKPMGLNDIRVMVFLLNPCISSDHSKKPLTDKPLRVSDKLFSPTAVGENKIYWHKSKMNLFEVEYFPK